MDEPWDGKCERKLIQAGIGCSKGNGHRPVNFGPVIGRISQNDQSGIVGVIGEYPRYVPIHLTVQDKDTGKDVVYQSRIAYNEEMVGRLSKQMVNFGIQRAMLSTAGVAAQVHFDIKAAVAPKGIYSYDDVLYKQQGISTIAGDRLEKSLGIILSDGEKDPDVTDINVKVVVSRERNTASIIKVIPDTTAVRPGEIVNLKIQLRPYRKPIETITIPYTVPQGQPAGILKLYLQGGGAAGNSMITGSTGLGNIAAPVAGLQDQKAMSAQSIKYQLKSSEKLRGNEIAVTSRQTVTARKINYATKYVIDNSAGTELSVESND